MADASGPSLTKPYSEGYQLAKRLAYLALFPLIMDLVFLTGKYLSTESLYTFRIGAKFSLPVYFPTLTNVYSFPTAPGITIETPLGGVGVIGLLSVVVVVVATALLSAGYLGTMHAAISGVDSAFVTPAVKFFSRFLAYGLIWLLLGYLALPFAAALPLVFLYIAFIWVLTYFIFLTPFIVVAEDCGLVEAFSRSVKVTTSRASETIPFVVVYAFITLVVSVPVYLLLNIPILGFVLAVAGYAFVGTVLVASTSRFYYNLARPAVQQPPEQQPTPTAAG